MVLDRSIYIILTFIAKSPPVVKAGECPEPEGEAGFGVCLVECENDQECDAELKCCANACGGGICVAPAPLGIKMNRQCHSMLNVIFET